MILSKLSINRPVMITMIILVFIVFGLLAYFSLPLNLMPDVEFPFVTVQVIYPGAGPLEIESQVVKKIEDAISTISRIDYIESYAVENFGFVLIRFELGKDVNIASQEVKDKIEAIKNNLPSDAESPVISRFDVNASPIMNLVFTGNIPGTELYEIADKLLKDRLSQIEGVAQVELSGGREREIHIELDEKVVFQNEISLPQLAQILAAHNIDMPGGSFTKADQEYSVRLNGRFEDIKTLEELEIPTHYGVKQLRQIAEIKDTGSDVRQRTTYFNNLENYKQENVIKIDIIKSVDGNPVEISDQVRKELPGIRALIPDNTELSIIDDDADFIQAAVDDTLGNIILGIVLTGIILFFFLHDLRSTIIVALAMPTSIISTFLLLQISGFTINVLTLMGLSTAVGILVTNSVVVIENIFRHIRMGNRRKEAANKGTSEIAVAVFASTLTNIVVFLPLATMGSIAGQFFKEFALTVTFATVFSLLISFTLTPMLASLILPEDHDKKKGKVAHCFDRMFDQLDNFYKNVLRILLRRKLISGGAIVIAFILFVLSFGVASRIGFEFMPNLDEGNLSIDVELPQGYSLQETAEVFQAIEERITTHPEVKHMIANIGSQGWVDKATNLGSAEVKLVDVDKRDFSTNDMIALLMQDVADIPNAKINVHAESGIGGGGIEFFLQGQVIEILEELKNEIVEKCADVYGLENFDNSSRAGKPEITLYPKRDKFAQVGATIFDLAFTLRTAIEGTVASQYKTEGEEYDIKVKLSEESVDSPEEIGNIPVVTPYGTYRISQLADVEFTSGLNKIIHRDKYTTIRFSGSSAKDVPEGTVAAGIRQKLAEVKLPEGYRISWGGSISELQDTTIEMLRVFIIAVLLTYMLLAAILESFVQPLYILLTLPLALIGVFLAVYISGQTMNIFSMMAIIMLVGIVVNNAILLLDYTNQLRKKGMKATEALIEACPTKLRPILMASFAIMLGMLPMALGIGSAGKEFRQAIGIVSIGGIFVSMFLTLIVIPSVYNIFTRRKHG
ncbi:MAG: efflux RND transporter permease subunit [Candidatus Cloacimonetes bacterium]|nr:efflux RND transporter permease subunit [Candidatus Cloacimonadota bacterium]